MGIDITELQYQSIRPVQKLIWSAEKQTMEMKWEKRQRKNEGWIPSCETHNALCAGQLAVGPEKDAFE
jgi:hypothetical protein